MSRKSLPYAFLAFLLAILLFMVGIRYGQHVERVNRQFSLQTSISPSPTTSPTRIPLAFAEYLHTGCKISFLVPNQLEKTFESSTSAVFSSDSKKLGIAVSCEKKNFVKEDKEVITNVNGSIRAYETKTQDATSYRFFHANTAKIVTLTTENSYLPLIEKSLKIVP